MKGNTLLIVGAVVLLAGGAYLYSTGALGGEKFGQPLKTVQPNLNRTASPVAGGIRNILGPGFDFTQFGSGQAMNKFGFPS